MRPARRPAPVPRRSVTLHAATLITILALLAVTVPSRAADPFYSGLVREGELAYTRGDFETAVKKLRIGCFGLLDEPVLLAEGLVKLALAQAAVGDQEGFEETFRRLAEVEERFGGYSEAQLTAEVRSRFQAVVQARVPGQVLAATPAFQKPATPLPPAPSPEEEERDLRTELENRTRSTPGDTEALLRLAELELEENRPKRALRTLDELLALDPGNQRALCRRGQTRMILGDCRVGLEDLEACTGRGTEPRVLSGELQCLVKMKRWPEAVALYDNLPPAARANSKIRNLGEKAEKKVAAASGGEPGAVVTSSTPAPTIAPDTPASESPTPDTSTPHASPPDTVAQPEIEEEVAPEIDPAADRARMAALRRDLDDADGLEDLRPVLEATQALANARPDWVDAQFLAAEAAYQASAWEQAVRFFRRGGGPGQDRPALLFYYAIALYESGETTPAAEAMRRALPAIQDSPFVRVYAEKILGDPESSR